MDFMVDESTGTAVVAYLRSLGHDVLAVAEAMPQATDQDILARALRDTRILITNDKDFGELVFRSGQGHHGVVLLRLGNESLTTRVAVVKSLPEHYGERLVGRFTVATEGRVRSRPASELP